MDFGFPVLTDSFLHGQDFLYRQFNDIAFYVEDEEQEHFYFNTFKELFPNLRFEKIFPLNGKKNVTDFSLLNIGDKTKVFIVDLDFDEILNIRIERENLFYLDRYSIENYLVCKKGIYELIREKNPRLKNPQIDLLIDFDNCLNECKLLLSELSCSFILIQIYSLGKDYFSINPPRDFDFSDHKPKNKNNFIENYFNEIETQLKSIDARITLKAQIKKHKRHYNSREKALKNIPGKYILNLVKYRLESMGLIHHVNLDSFTYKLSKEIDVNELLFLKTAILDYIT